MGETCMVYSWCSEETLYGGTDKAKVVAAHIVALEADNARLREELEEYHSIISPKGTYVHKHTNTPETLRAHLKIAREMEIGDVATLEQKLARAQSREGHMVKLYEESDADNARLREALDGLLEAARAMHSVIDAIFGYRGGGHINEPQAALRAAITVAEKALLPRPTQSKETKRG